MFLEAINLCVSSRGATRRTSPPLRYENKMVLRWHDSRVATLTPPPSPPPSPPPHRYDRDWKKIESYVGTNGDSNSQSRAKYFLKVRAGDPPSPQISRSRIPSLSPRRPVKTRRVIFLPARGPPAADPPAASLFLAPPLAPETSSRSKRTARASTSPRPARSASPRSRTLRSPRPGAAAARKNPTPISTRRMRVAPRTAAWRPRPRWARTPRVPPARDPPTAPSSSPPAGRRATSGSGAPDGGRVGGPGCSSSSSGGSSAAWAT